MENGSLQARKEKDPGAMSYLKILFLEMLERAILPSRSQTQERVWDSRYPLETDLDKLEITGVTEDGDEIIFRFQIEETGETGQVSFGKKKAARSEKSDEDRDSSEGDKQKREG